MAVGWAVSTDRAPVTGDQSLDSGASMRFVACLSHLWGGK